MIVVKEVFRMKGGWVKINEDGEVIGPFKNKTSAEAAEFPTKKSKKEVSKEKSEPKSAQAKESVVKDTSGDKEETDASRTTTELS
jgi:hypothetical protein